MSVKNKLKQFGDWLLDNSLWLAGLGLFIASSGIDGAYLVKLNEWNAVGGYALNTTSDIVSMLLMFWFGVFRQSENESKRKAAWGLVVSEIVTVAYSWLFSWRQYRMMIFDVETNPIGFKNEVEWLAFVFAGFIPLLLAFIGYAQGMQVSDNQTASDTMSAVDFSLPLDDFQQRLDDLQKQIEYLQYPQADLQWFKERVSSLNGSSAKYKDVNALDAVTDICHDGGRRFTMSERTATNWYKELTND